MSAFIESFLGTFLGLVIGSSVLMLFFVFGLKFLVRTIMNEIWNTAAERITSHEKEKKKKKEKDKDKLFIEPLMKK